MVENGCLLDTNAFVGIWDNCGRSFRSQHTESHLGLDFLGFDQHLDFLVFGKHFDPPTVDKHDMSFMVLECFCLDQSIDSQSLGPHNQLNDVQSFDHLGYQMVVQVLVFSHFVRWFNNVFID